MLLQAFFQRNRAIAANLSKYLPQGPCLAFTEYEEVVIKYMHDLERPVILDVGGGSECYFSPYKSPGSRLICLDISPEQLARNRDADDLVLADATQGIPLADACVDLVISRAVLEHLRSPLAFLYDSHRVLKPGGFGIHVFPCKFAPFAMINGLLPTTWARKLLFFFQKDYQDKGGFPAYYYNCYHTGIKRLLNESGFCILEMRHYHSQSVYFDFFLPLFLLSALYEIVTLPIKNLAAFLLIVVQKI
jgi:SAM-dependent methyltransferase